MEYMSNNEIDYYVHDWLNQVLESKRMLALE